MSGRSRFVLAGAVLALACAALAGFLLIAGAPVQSTAGTKEGALVAVSCDRATGVTEDECGAWADAILRGGPPSSTFEMDDLAGLELREAGGECRVSYFISRYPDDPAWEEETPCRFEDLPPS